MLTRIHSPYKFEAPWEDYEFSSHALKTGARLVVLSMAWCTHVDQQEFFRKPAEPDMDTLLYWITRLQPIIAIDSNQETIIVFGNRCGAEGDATYVGTSTVIGIKSGEISLYGILGRDEESLLVVDTDALPYAKLNLQSHDPEPAQDGGEDILGPRAHHERGPSDQRRNGTVSGTGIANGMGGNNAPPTDVQEHTLDTIMVTRGPERDPHHNDHWMEPSRRPREHPTSGPFRVDGSSVGITSSSSHVSYTQFTQSYVAAPVTQRRGIDVMRPTMSEGDYNTNRLDEFSESDEEPMLSDSYSESDEGCGSGRRRHAASTQRGNRTQDTGKRYPTAHRPPDGMPNPHSEQDAASESSLVQRISAVALDNEILPSSTAENFKEEDIYKYIRGKNLTSEHHIRYHTHLLRERRAKQGLPEDPDDDEDDEDDQEECQEQHEEDLIFEAHIDRRGPRPDPRHVADVEPSRMELPILAPASHNRVRTGLGAQPNNTHGNVAQAKQPFWQEHPPEPTPIADTPMSHMTQFSQTRTRRRHERHVPAFATAAPSQTRRQPHGRHAEEPDSGTKTGDSGVGEIRIAGIPELASTDSREHATFHERLPALSRSTAKENAVPLQDPSRRPKVAAKQVPPLRLVPREAPKEKQREREVRERSRRTPRQVPIARETGQRDKGRDKGRKTPVPMVLVYEGEEESMPLPHRRY